MQIFVSLCDSKTIVIRNALPNDTVQHLKEVIEEKSGVPADEQSLTCSSTLLLDGVLADYGIQELSTIDVNMRLLGGAKKRKKKNYSTPKKIKHKKKKVKLAVLKYYKVDENGKIFRLRRECPSDSCGAGVFMAAMTDRHYCGKCHYTLVYDENEK